mgnify:CR=1 FL=1
MKKVFVIGLLCLSQTGCLAITAVGLVTDVAVAIVKVPIKVGGAVGGAMIDVVTGDDDSGAEAGSDVDDSEELE